MPYFDQQPFKIRCEWGADAVENPARCDVIVIVDVLSFTTSVEVAVSRSANVLPYPAGIDTAQHYAYEHNTVLA